ncbi:hypothetical protein [Clostridium manihotivorum]|uniref:Uncharacterized protein n=1 Tax=Clostridium manihotivorum TaxID=2320868 RepID=A0A3R5QRU0_9CLOT|nr:hypothetical protein [Clostridium manihotivorum]QAA30924.1 hypothetical protein C1I91_04170 [Clostridium manihotivorum]
MEVFRKYKKVWIIFIIIAMLVALGATVLVRFIIGKSGSIDTFSERAAIEYNTGSKWNESYSYLNGTKSNKVKLKKDQILNIEYSSAVKEGSLKILLQDADGNTIANLLDDSSGLFKYKAEKDGRYIIKVVGDKTEGEFNLKWEIK